MIFLNPSAESLSSHCRDAVASAQAGRRNRLVTDAEIASCVHDALTLPDGWVQVDGGGVANSYGYRATTTRLGVAWWTDSAGARHVRVVCDRHGISGRHVSCVLGNVRTMDACHPAQRVYPFVAVPSPMFSGRTEAARQERAFLRTIAGAPMEVASWQMYADWLADRGQDESAVRIRDVAQRIEAAALPTAVAV